MNPLGKADPIACKKACIVSGNARFTVLTPRVVRLEWAEDGVFEDRASFAFVNRRLPPPRFSVRKRSGNGCEIDTGAICLRYAGGRFSPETLSADIAPSGDFPGSSWRFGDEEVGNLLGTCRTLDGVKGWDQLLPRMEKGVVSRAGWTVVDDSATPLFEPSGDHWERWVAPRRDGDRLDLCLFAHGHDYKGALADFTRLSGRIPMPPRWALGYWWSRFWTYSDAELRELVLQLETFGIPLDVLVIDMDWHDTWGYCDVMPHRRDEFGQAVGWTGYTWKKELFPAPERFLSWCRSRGLKVALNLHPASGIQPQEECYRRFCRAYRWKDAATRRAVPYRMEEPRWADCYFREVLGPLEKQGVGFWWLDWQQWKQNRTIPSLSETFWLNRVFFRHEAEKGTRPIIYHRWGGLGSHRYQVAFSGDIKIGWEALSLLPWFTSTSANVGYGWWGHDTGGHICPEGLGADPELFLRWLQYAVFTPVFKTHCTKDSAIERRPWMYPRHQFAMREAYRLRYRLSHVLYAAAREAWETGVSPCRPMYYDWPEEDVAYDRTLRQHLFGPDVLATVVAGPTDPSTGLAAASVWFPPETIWFDAAHGTVVRGGGPARPVPCALHENPWFLRAGAAIPLRPDLPAADNISRGGDTACVTWLVAPGAESGGGVFYEDGGDSPDYAVRFSKTILRWKRSAFRLCAEIVPDGRSFPGAPKRRAWELRFPLVSPPRAVRIDGSPAPWSREGGEGTWTYDGPACAVVVALPTADRLAARTVELVFPKGAAIIEKRLEAKPALFSRAAGLMEDFKIDFTRVKLAAMPPRDFLAVSQTGTFLSEDPQNAARILDGCEGSLAALPSVFDSLERDGVDKTILSRLRAQLL